MSEILDAVARAVMIEDICGCTFEGERVFCDDARLPSEVQHDICWCKKSSRAAIKATLEHLRDNQSKEMIEVGNSEIDDCIDFWNYDSGAGYCVEQRAARTTMAAMLSQAITELNEEA